MERLYGEYKPISEDTKKVIDDLYEGFGPNNNEVLERKIAYDVAADGRVINQDVLFAGATSINDAYMLRNTHRVVTENGVAIRSLKLRDCKDDNFENSLKDYLMKNPDSFEVVADNLKTEDVDKRKNFELLKPTLYRVKSGEYAGVCFSVGKKDGKSAIFLDIANTPFEKLTKSWQSSNFDPFEFAFKLVETHPELSEDQMAAAVHVYWLTSNGWAIEYKDPMAVPYGMLDRVEQDKDKDNVAVAGVYKDNLAKLQSVNQEICKDICRTAKRMLADKIYKEQNNIQEKDKERTL